MELNKHLIPYCFNPRNNKGFYHIGLQMVTKTTQNVSRALGESARLGKLIE